MAVILLCGGDNGSQANDFNTAKRLLAEWMESDGSKGPEPK